MNKLWEKKHLKKKTDIFRNNIFQEHLSTAVDLKRKRYAQTERCLETESWSSFSVPQTLYNELFLILRT